MSKQPIIFGDAQEWKIIFSEHELQLVLSAIPLLDLAIFIVPLAFNFNLAPTTISLAIPWVIPLIITTTLSIAHLIYFANYPESDRLNKLNYTPRAKRVVTLLRLALCAGSLCFTTMCFQVMTWNLLPIEFLMDGKEEEWNVNKNLLIATLPFFFVDVLAVAMIGYCTFSARPVCHEAKKHGDEWILDEEE